MKVFARIGSISLNHWRRHFGKEILATQIGVEIDHPKVHVLWLQLYKVNPDISICHRSFDDSLSW